LNSILASASITYNESRSQSRRIIPVVASRAQTVHPLLLLRLSTVLFVRPKIKELGLHLFGRSIHPELFEPCAARVLERENYWLDYRITTCGHLLTFQHQQWTLTEVCAGLRHDLPQQRRMVSAPIESLHRERATLQNAVTWSSEFQIEGVNPRVFVDIQQQLEQQKECEGLLHRFEPSGRSSIGGVSYIHLQAFRRHVQVRCFHTFPDTSAVVKSLTVFGMQD
jgi:hypothetical protein